MTEYKYKQAIFLDSQIPNFIKDQYPLFVSFLKSYYDYLDRAKNEIVSVKIKNKGKNYKENTTQIQLYVIDINPYSPTYGQYIPDNRPLSFVPKIWGGRLEKVLVQNSKGLKYSKEEYPHFIITDTGGGTGAEIEPVILYDVGNIYNAAQDVPYIRDIDIENDIFRKYLIEELISSIPNSLYTSQDPLENVSVDVKKFVKFIKQIYNSKGIEDVFSFIYRILYNVPVQFYYPKTDILRVSDGVWIKGYYLVVDFVDSNVDINEYIGKKIVNGEGVTGIIMNAEPHPTLPNKWKLEIHERTGSFGTSGDAADLYSYSFKFIKENDVPFATIYSIEEDPIGYFKNDNGQLSSKKKIQDNYYYQDFSYELQSAYNIKEYDKLIRELLNPAGFKYFIKILVENELVLNVNSSLYYNKIVKADKEYVLGEESYVYKTMLGMTFKDIYKKNFGYNYPFQNKPFSVTISVTPNTSITELEIFNISSPFFETSYLQENTFYGYALVIQTTEGNVYRSIVKVNPSTNSVVLDSPFTTAGSSVTATMYPGYFFKQVINETGFVLSDYDFFNFAIYNDLIEGRYLNGYSLYILSGNGEKEFSKVTGYLGLSRTLIIQDPFSVLPNTNSIYIIFPDLDGSEYFGGTIESVNVIKGGSGYVSPSFIVESPIGSSIAPTFNVTVDSGSITAITKDTTEVSNYFTIPESSLTDPGGGSGCVYEIIVDLPKFFNIEYILPRSILQGISFYFDKNCCFAPAKLRVIVENNIITSVEILDAGSGYWFTPYIYQNVGDGYGGKIKVVFDESTGTIQNPIVSSFGQDYNYDPEFIVEDPEPKLNYFFTNSDSTTVLKLLNKDEENVYYTLLYDGLQINNIESLENSSMLYYNKSINISNVRRFYTGYLQCKYGYNTEIETLTPSVGGELPQ